MDIFHEVDMSKSSLVDISNHVETEFEGSPIIKTIQISILKMRFVTFLMDANEYIGLNMKKNRKKLIFKFVKYII